ncbi:MAG: LuxR C-terminal-related transcriptional regulator [Vulcanimicrobiaceae bacterium]
MVHLAGGNAAFRPVLKDAGFARAIEAALGGIPHAAWVAVRYGPARELSGIVLGPGHDADALVEIARAEHGLLFLDRSPGKVVPTRAAIAAYVDGQTLVLGNGGLVCGLLTVLRTALEGRFTAAEREALEALLEPLTAQAFAPSAAGAPNGAFEQIRSRAQAALFVVDQLAAIQSYWLPRRDDWHAALFGTAVANQFAPAVEAAIRAQIGAFGPTDGESVSRVAIVPPSTVLRIARLAGIRTDEFAVTIERLQTRKTIELAADRFALSRREREVLALLLEGHGTTGVAEILKIATSTANDHVKRMLIKTSSRNRAELVARALGWGHFVHDR